jgi:hypothetical protein
MSTLLIRRGPSGFVSLIDRNMRLGSDAKTVLVYDVAILVVSQSRFVPEPFYMLTLVALWPCVVVACRDNEYRYGGLWYIR